MCIRDRSLMAQSITDETIASRLCDIGTVQVKAAYEFYQMDEQIYNFVLHPNDVVCPGGDGAPETVKIAFAQNYGGDADYFNHSITFNLSPTELWVGDKKYEQFKQLVYHFGGTYE